MKKTNLHRVCREKGNKEQLTCSTIYQVVNTINKFNSNKKKERRRKMFFIKIQ